jgi:predicted RNA binding protein YcfA (HicA-like mRNA interferase family)
MKRRDLVHRLHALGWVPVRQGKHEIFGTARTDRTIPVPRHSEIDDHTARGILREAAK